MPSKRSSAIIGIWVFLAVLLIADFFLFNNLLLDNLYLGLSGLINILIIAFLPIMAASLLLDRRSQPVPSTEPPERLPRGTRSATGEPVPRTRPKPRIKRSKRAAKLETIVVEPGSSRNSPVSVNSASSSPSSPREISETSSRFLRSHRAQKVEEEMDQQVKEQLDALELEMAKLEEQLEQDGVLTSSNSDSPSPPVTDQTVSPTKAVQTSSSNSSLSSEEVSSERQAIDELLNRLEQRKRAGGVDEDTYQRLREKYLKRRSEFR